MEYVLLQISHHLESFEKRRGRNRRWSTTLTVATGVLAAMIPVLRGIAASPAVQTVLKNVALVVGGLLAVLKSANRVLGRRALWIQYTEVCNRLRSFRAHIQYHAVTVGEISDSAVDEFFAQLQGILGTANAGWVLTQERADPIPGHEGKEP